VFLFRAPSLLLSAAHRSITLQISSVFALQLRHYFLLRCAGLDNTASQTIHCPWAEERENTATNMMPLGGVVSMPVLKYEDK